MTTNTTVKKKTVSANNKPKSNKFEIGQIIYILSDKTTKIFPAIVAEEVVVKTLQGNKCEWTLFIGPENNRKTVALDKVPGEIFSSLQDLEKELERRLLAFVKSTVTDARTKEREWYAAHIKSTPVDEADELLEEEQDDSSDDNKKIDIDDLVASASSPQPSKQTVVQEKQQPQEPQVKFRLKTEEGTVIPLNE